MSDPLPGATHDLTALKRSGLLDGQDPTYCMADKGDQGSGIITPIRKPIDGITTTQNKTLNNQINHCQTAIERGNPHLKDWKVPHIDHRRPLNTFQATITAAIDLYVFTHSE